MPLKVLPSDYKPESGDIRSESLSGSGTFRVDVYTGVAWERIADLPGDLLESVTGGTETLLGRGPSGEGEGDKAAYWRFPKKQGPVQAQPGDPWYAVVKMPKNRIWQAPRYGLGELVWRRSDPRALPDVIVGVELVEGWYYKDNYSGEEDSSPQTWQYRLAGQKEMVEQERLVGRSELAWTVTVVAGQMKAVLANVAADFDPFLEDLP